MPLVAYLDGTERMMGVVLEGPVTPLGPLADFYADVASGLETARGMRAGTLSLTALRQVPPVPETARVLCAGINYRTHSQETGLKLPEHPDICAPGEWSLGGGMRDTYQD